jgi:hypothetical protein
MKIRTKGAMATKKLSVPARPLYVLVATHSQPSVFCLHRSFLSAKLTAR